MHSMHVKLGNSVIKVLVRQVDVACSGVAQFILKRLHNGAPNVVTLREDELAQLALFDVRLDCGGASSASRLAHVACINAKKLSKKSSGGIVDAEHAHGIRTSAVEHELMTALVASD